MSKEYEHKQRIERKPIRESGADSIQAGATDTATLHPPQEPSSLHLPPTGCVCTDDLLSGPELSRDGGMAAGQQ